MPLHEHKALLRRYVEELNQRRYAILDELVAEDVRVRSLLRLEQSEEHVLTGRAAYRAAIVRRIEAFPDYHVTIQELIAEADQVMLYWRNRGTHLGTFRGIPPSGKVIEEMAISIYRIMAGQIIEVRGFGDTYDFWHQVGRLPEL
jgi:steroid delta-isomerase-like uncharacterized protein